METRSRIEGELKDALKRRDSLTVSVLRMLLAAIKNKEVEKLRPLTLDEFYALVKTSVKQHHESIESFRKGGRSELAEKEEQELAILEKFLPASLSEDELLREIEGAILSLDAKGQKEMGKVIKYILEKFPGRIDGKVLSQMVLKRLSAS